MLPELSGYGWGAAPGGPATTSGAPTSPKRGGKISLKGR